MAITSCVSTNYRHLVDSEVLRMAVLSNYFNLEEITTARKVSAADFRFQPLVESSNLLMTRPKSRSNLCNYYCLNCDN